MTNARGCAPPALKAGNTNKPAAFPAHQMADLIQVSEHCYYFSGPTQVGLVRTADDEVCLIDSGCDKSAGRAVRKALDARGWRLSAIYCTHSHADHIGANRFLSERTGCRIYAPEVECAFTRHTLLEPSLLYGGCPHNGLRSKFLMAEPSAAEPLCPEALPSSLSVLPLPGHSPDMVGYCSHEGVIYPGDCLASRATLDKYRICYIYDVAAYLRSLESLISMQAACFVPAHAEATDDIAPLARYNIEQVHAVARCILSHCRRPIGTDELLRRVADSFGISLTIGQHALVGSTLRSYLAWLCDDGRLTPSIEDNRLLWLSADSSD